MCMCVCACVPKEQSKDNVSSKFVTGGVLAMCVVHVDKSFPFIIFIKMTLFSLG